MSYSRISLISHTHSSHGIRIWHHIFIHDPIERIKMSGQAMFCYPVVYIKLPCSTFFFSFGLYAGLHIEGIYSRKQKRERKARKWWKFYLDRSNEYPLFIEFFATHMSDQFIYVCVTLSPIPSLQSKIYIFAMPKMEVLNSSILTVVSIIISSRGCMVLPLTVCHGRHGLAFVSILWTFSI